MMRSSIAVLAFAAALTSASAESGAALPVAVPLSSAFTLEGIGHGQTDNLFSEYVLHVARPGAGSPVRISDWARPREEMGAPSKALVAAAERPASSRRAVQSPVILVHAEDTAVAHAAVSEKATSFLERWAASLPSPDFGPTRAKVVGAVTQLGGRVADLIPRVW